SPAANLDVTKNQNATTNIAINNSDTNANSRAQLNLTSGSVAARLLTIHNDSLYLGTTTSSGFEFPNGSNKCNDHRCQSKGRHWHHQSQFLVARIEECV